MSHWEGPGQSDDWYTPAYIFDALGCRFDLDVSAPEDFTQCHVPASEWLFYDSLEWPWHGFIWMNPPFGGRNGLEPWLDRFFQHGNGIALTPDRTSAPWWQTAARKADAILFIAGKVKFQRPDGSFGKHPGTGTTLFAKGLPAMRALCTAERAGLGYVMREFTL